MEHQTQTTRRDSLGQVMQLCTGEGGKVMRDENKNLGI